MLGWTTTPRPCFLWCDRRERFSRPRYGGIDRRHLRGLGRRWYRFRGEGIDSGGKRGVRDRSTLGVRHAERERSHGEGARWLDRRHLSARTRPHLDRPFGVWAPSPASDRASTSECRWSGSHLQGRCIGPNRIARPCTPDVPAISGVSTIRPRLGGAPCRYPLGNVGQNRPALWTLHCPMWGPR